MAKEYLTQIGSGIIDTIIDLLIVVVIFVVAKFIVNVVSKITDKTMERADTLEDKDKSKEIKTSMTITHSVNRYAVYVVAVILCLNVLGFGKEVSAAIVAAGIGGLVLSLGAQSIVKDMIAGLFLLFEKQYFVGDYVEIGEYEGTVVSIALRVTYLDSFGKRVIIPNGEIRDLINYNRTDGLALIYIPTSYESNTRKAMEIIDKVIDKYYEENRKRLTRIKPNPCEVYDFEDTCVTILAKVYTKPLLQWTVERELRLLIKEELEKNRIKMPYCKVVASKKEKDE